jgi:hypothetical protein
MFLEESKSRDVIAINTKNRNSFYNENFHIKFTPNLRKVMGSVMLTLKAGRPYLCNLTFDIQYAEVILGTVSSRRRSLKAHYAWYNTPPTVVLGYHCKKDRNKQFI